MRDWMLKPVHTGFDTSVSACAAVSLVIYAESSGLLAGLIAFGAIVVLGAIASVFYARWDARK